MGGNMKRIALAIALAALLVSGVVTFSPGALAVADCTIVGTSGPDELVGTQGPDVICGLGGADTINGRGGADVIRGGNGDDYLKGRAGDDLLRGGLGNDYIVSGKGHDTVYGGRGSDGCLRTADNAPGDNLVGGQGQDTYRADDGDLVSTAEISVAACEDPPTA
jgi:Ca2+-binding RTX toxin-like protein